LTFTPARFFDQCFCRRISRFFPGKLPGLLESGGNGLCSEAGIKKDTCDPVCNI